jgi:hypothetical protein
MWTRRIAAFLVVLCGAVFLASVACAQKKEGARPDLFGLLETPSPLPTGVPQPSLGQSEGQGEPARPAYVLQGFPEVRGSFGYSLATGDIDGDGRDDVIVGAPWPGVTPGKVFAFLGGEEFGGQPDAILKDPDVGPSTGFGYFLAAGDVNGDNEDEVIVGKPAGGAKVFVFSDSASSLGVPTAVLEDPERRAGSFLGYPVAVGDVNGDGYEDVIAGAPLLDVGQYADAGAVFVFLGGNPLDAAPDSVLQAPEPQTGAWFGRSVAAGDVNGDGLDDVVVGAYSSSVDGLESAGKVFVFLSGGPPGETSVRILQDPTPQVKANLGYGVAAGDIDGDGYDDVIAGAFGATVNSSYGAGKALVFRGSPDFDVKVDAEVQDPNPEPSAGFAYVLRAADVNGDGFDDLLIGAPYSDVEGLDAAGEAFLFLGGSPAPSYEAERTFAAPVAQSYAYFGISVAAGDIDGTGASDVIVGAYRTNVDAQSGAGQVFVFPPSSYQSPP